MKIQSERIQRKCRSAGIVLSLFLMHFMASTGWAAIPAVSNIQVQQSTGTTILEITYDLQDDDGDFMHVSAVVSLDGGITWPTVCRTVSGDVGSMVASGSQLSFEWDAGADLNDFVGENCRVRIFATDVSPYPEMEYFRIVGTDTLAMSRTVPDTIAYAESLQLMWRARTPVLDGLPAEIINEMDSSWPYDDGIMGYKWRLMEDNCNPEISDCWHPRYYDQASGDSVSYFAEGVELVFQNDGSGFDPWSRLLDSGEFAMRFTTLDIAGTELLHPSLQGFSFVVNYDPETILLKGETDWAHPDDPEIYPYYTLLNDPEQIHYPFTEGDRIPDRSYVVFKALFRDDPRDNVVSPAYSMGSTGTADGIRENYTGGFYGFQIGSSSVDTDPTWDAGLHGFYADTLGFMPSPRTEFTFRMTAVDEHGRRDGTPDEMSFQVGFPPCVQCLELVPNYGDGSSYTQELACYDPEVGGHPCFNGDQDFYILEQGEAALADRSYLTNQGPIYMGIHKGTGQVYYSETEFDGLEYYSFPSDVYSMGLYLHGQDDSREAWSDPRSRSMGWRYQVDYECDPGNSIADGGGIDDLSSPTWGQTSPYEPGLEISPVTGLWKLKVDVVVPRILVDLGAENFRLVILYSMANGDAELADDLFNKCIRQLGSGQIQAIALDQTKCGFYPLRPAKYHVFTEVRPAASGPGNGTWRDCDPTFSGVDYSLDLFRGTMGSLDNIPVEKNFQILFQGSDGDLGCQVEGNREKLTLPHWLSE